MTKNDAFPQPDDRFKGVIQTPRVAVHLLKDDGTIPNNDQLPLLVYQGALSLPDQNPAAVVEALFRARFVARRNLWLPSLSQYGPRGAGHLPGQG